MRIRPSMRPKLPRRLAGCVVVCVCALAISYRLSYYAAGTYTYADYLAAKSSLHAGRKGRTRRTA
jgi:hypothetical protein